MATKTAKKSNSSRSASKSSKGTASKATASKSSRSTSKAATSRGGSSRGSAAKSAGGRSSSGTSGRSSASNQTHQRKNLMMKFFVDALKDIYWAEKAGVKAMKKMAKNATSEELREAFEDHRVMTETHVERLEQVFEMMELRPQAKKCEAMAGLIEEVESTIEETKDDTFTRDAALIIGAQKAEHYEIAAYGGLTTLAKTMGHMEVAELLAETLEEEKQTDELLTSIAESAINSQASMEEGEEED